MRRRTALVAALLSAAAAPSASQAAKVVSGETPVGAYRAVACLSVDASGCVDRVSWVQDTIDAGGKEVAVTVRVEASCPTWATLPLGATFGVPFRAWGLGFSGDGTGLCDPPSDVASDVTTDLKRFEAAIWPRPGRFLRPWRLYRGDQVLVGGYVELVARRVRRGSVRTITDRQRDAFFNVCLSGDGGRIVSRRGVLQCTVVTLDRYRITARIR